MKTEDIKISPKWGKSKEEIWANMFAELEDSPKTIEITQRKKTVWRYAAAAVITIAIVMCGTAFFYTKTIVAERGTQLAVTLPDGSEVNLNAESQISFKPLWWFISRNVQLKGEAFFEVKKGSTFQVHSNPFTVSVLGTSFNVFSRNESFNVTCLTGKVNVSDQSESVLLTPNMQALQSNGKLITKERKDAQKVVGWKEGKFVFVGVPLQEVIQEIERQYDIKVFSDSDLNHTYSGNFTNSKNPDEVLKIIGKAFGIEFKIK